MNRTRIRLAWKMWGVGDALRKVADGIKAREQDIVLAAPARLPTLLVMEAFRIPAYAMSVDVVAMNQPFFRHFSRNPEWPTTAEQAAEGLAEGAYSVRLDTKSPREGYWPGHLIAIVRGHLVDTAAIASHRPHHGILLPDIFVGKITPGFLRKGNEVTYHPNPTTWLWYAPRREDESWKTLSGFEDSEDNRDMARKIVARMRDRLTRGDAGKHPRLR